MGKWKSLHEVHVELEAHSDRERLANLVALRDLALNAIYSAEFRTPDVISEVVIPTPAGEELIDLSAQRLATIPRSDVLFALLGHFYHTDLLVDASRTDVAALRRIIDDLISKRILRIPHRFGRLLYDRFNSGDLTEPEPSLSATETDALLDGTPQGVYQLGKLLAGPFGLLESAEYRYLPLSMSVALWHCADTGCGTFHSVHLRSHDNAVTDAYSALDDVALDRLGIASEYFTALRRLLRPGNWAAGRPYRDLPVLLNDALVGTEGSRFMSLAIERHASALRAELATFSETKALAKRSAADIASNLGETQRLQLLLVLEDVALVELLDAAALTRALVIPGTEIRSARQTPPKISPYDSDTELSALGVRSKVTAPLTALFEAIWTAYETAGSLEDLGWKITQRFERVSRDQLMTYLMSTDIRQAVDQLVLGSSTIARSVAARTGISVEARQAEEASLLDLLLWKYGFRTFQYSEEHTRFKKHLDDFYDAVVRTASIRTEADREQLRKAGVNLFVLLEHVLEEVVAFNTWLLGSDVFLRERLTYRPSRAVTAVGEILGSTVTLGAVQLTWNPIGGNTLGVLLAYANAASQWMALLSTTGRNEYLRPNDELPERAAASERPFPFMHRALWADCNAGDLAQFASGFATVVQAFNRSECAAVRNGLDHRRAAEEFPTLAQMIDCCNQLRTAFDLADERRYLPKPMWLTEHKKDRFGRGFFSYVDYRGRTTQVLGPSVVNMRREAQFLEPKVISSLRLLGQPNSEVVLSIQQESEYSRYWNGFPVKRRRRSSAVSDVTTPSDDAELMPGPRPDQEADYAG